jgi:hypothetical protein
MWVMRTSHKQHLALLLDRPYAGLLVVVFLLRNEYCLFDVSENEVAMRIVCLSKSISLQSPNMILEDRACA